MKLDVLIPAYRIGSRHAWNAIEYMIAWTARAGHDIHAPFLTPGSVIHWSRNEALNASRKDADFILFCDDDMLPLRDAALKLMERDVPLVSAFMVTKDIPCVVAGREYIEKEDAFGEIAWMKPGKLITGKFALGMGFTLMKRWVFDQLLEYHLNAGDWLEQNRRMFDRLHIRTEAREAERERVAEKRRALYALKKTHRVFDFLVTENETQCGEDIAFSRNCMKLGIPTAIDTDCKVGHLGEFPYTPDNLEDDSHESVRWGGEAA